MPNLIKFHNIRHVVPLFQLLLSLQQRVHAVVTAADLLVVLLLQHGGDAAQAADAASPGAHPTVPPPYLGRMGMNGASKYTEVKSSPADQLFCAQMKGELVTAWRHTWCNLTLILIFFLQRFAHTYEP